MAVCLQMELEYRSWGVHTDMHEVPPGQNGVCIKKKKKKKKAERSKRSCHQSPAWNLRCPTILYSNQVSQVICNVTLVKAGEWNIL